MGPSKPRRYPRGCFWGGQVDSAGLAAPPLPLRRALHVTSACLDYAAPSGDACLWFQLGRSPPVMLCTLSLQKRTCHQLAFLFSGGEVQGRFSTSGAAATIHLSGYFICVDPEKDAQMLYSPQDKSIEDAEEEEEDEDYMPPDSGAEDQSELSVDQDQDEEDDEEGEEDEDYMPPDSDVENQRGVSFGHEEDEDISGSEEQPSEELNGGDLGEEMSADEKLEETDDDADNVDDNDEDYFASSESDTEKKRPTAVDVDNEESEDSVREVGEVESATQNTSDVPMGEGQSGARRRRKKQLRTMNEDKVRAKEPENSQLISAKVEVVNVDADVFEDGAQPTAATTETIVKKEDVQEKKEQNVTPASEKRKQKKPQTEEEVRPRTVDVGNEESVDNAAKSIEAKLSKSNEDCTPATQVSGEAKLKRKKSVLRPTRLFTEKDGKIDLQRKASSNESGVKNTTAQSEQPAGMEKEAQGRGIQPK